MDGTQMVNKPSIGYPDLEVMRRKYKELIETTKETEPFEKRKGLRSTCKRRCMANKIIHYLSLVTPESVSIEEIKQLKLNTAFLRHKRNLNFCNYMFFCDQILALGTKPGDIKTVIKDQNINKNSLEVRNIILNIIP